MLNENDVATAAATAKTQESEAFVIYYNDNALNLQWRGVPTLQRTPAIRLCTILPQIKEDKENITTTSNHWLVLLTTDHTLYSGHLVNNQRTLELQLLRNDIVDVDFCRETQELFIACHDGSVQRQRIVGNTYRPSAWQKLSFDPLELCADGVCIRNICCSAQGTVFISATGDTYVMGSCGDVFNSETQPLNTRLYDEGKDLLDIAAGDEHFVMLLGAPYNHHDDDLQLQSIKDTTTDTAADQVSLSSDSNQTERSFAANTRHLLQQGYALLNTQLFGATNNGLLGTGDHIRRANVARVLSLDSVGVCNIAAGREHTVARTLDGRLYHWGLRCDNNSDLSAPKEITISTEDDQQLTAEEHSALEATCGDYRTLLLNAMGKVHAVPAVKQQSTFAQTMLHLQLGAAWPRQLRLLHCSRGGFTLHNCRQFQRQYHYYLSHLQSQLQMLLKYRPAVETLHQLQLQSMADDGALNALKSLLINWQRMLCLLAATLHSLEGFYRADYEQAADLLFICYYKEYIELFDAYTKSYCDVYSVDGFGEAVKVIATLNSHLSAELSEESYVTRLFQQPFQIHQTYLQFIELLVKTQPEYEEHRIAWMEFARQSCISQELAVNTKEFWATNKRDTRIRNFRRPQRRVILTSAAIPLKLNTTLPVASNTFILFSDFLCQLGLNSRHTYPLGALWLHIEGEMGIRIITPEKTFMVQTKTHEQRKLWLDQLQSSIVAALGKPLGSPVPNVRTTGYVYSKDHGRFPNVKACGTWRKGLLHRNCYLEYPDGSVYCGDVHNGVIEGYGKMLIPSTGLYIGGFKDGRFHGFGIYELNGNETYEGYFSEGLYHGHGMLRNNRYNYIGEYQANTRSGYGVLEDLLSGDKYMGLFADNKWAGAGICITARGDYFEGIFAGEDLTGIGVAVFENENYYEGELTIHGPNGKGELYIPTERLQKADLFNDDDDANQEVVGNKMSGQLSGTWQQVRIQQGEFSMNRRFPKYPTILGQLLVDHNRKWRSLFANFEMELSSYGMNSSTSTTASSGRKQSLSVLSTSQLWSCISIYMTKQRLREPRESSNYFERNILLTGTIIPTPGKPPRRIHSQEMLNKSIDDDDGKLQRADSLRSMGHRHTLDTGDAGSYASFRFNSNLIQSSSSRNGSCASIATTATTATTNTTTTNNNNNNNSIVSTLDTVPSFGMGSSLTTQDIDGIRMYLGQAFKDPHHPLYALNERITNCFHYSYGYWKVKPTAILAKQAMLEWESISRRIYRFVRKMFPALPDDYCQLVDGTREVISHITLLYPLVLSEGIYSTLFVLYANKCSRKDEIYRQNLNFVEKLPNDELIEILGLEGSLSAVMLDSHFSEAIEMLKQLQEKFTPKDMLIVIQECMELLTEAYKRAMEGAAEQLNADSMMPLTLLSMLRAAVPHLGAELALLDDLTGGANFQAEMSGLAGYCYTTLKAAYEHVTSKVLQRTLTT